MRNILLGSDDFFSVFHVESEVSLSFTRAQERECAVITNDVTLILQRGQGSGSCLGHVGLGLGLGLSG